MTQSRTPNRLATEKSPYLLQHSYNPVDWYAWDETALAKAKAEDKPIFLSIGYSACHWCHVIARESFESEEVAEVLRRGFISVKVDKEERADIDAVYMLACQAMTGSGGWPLTILVLPDGRPFYADMYLPRPALIRLLETAEDMWHNQREKLVQTAEQVTAALSQMRAPASSQVQETNLPLAAYARFCASYDERWGGFGRAPKFPSAHNLLFLMAYSRANGDQYALKMAENTLIRMYRGGMFDHIGGGFCRYSTDEKWLIPHFEKMLYDNALLLWAYAEAYALTTNPLFLTIAQRTGNYILNELCGPEGEIYSSQDADSEGSEGAFYALTPQELQSVLEERDARAFCDWYGITQEGNFEGKSIPNLLHNDNFAMDNDKIGLLRRKVYEWREARVHLGLDDKVLTAWNALAITALAKSAVILEDDRFSLAAEKAMAFLKAHLMDEQGRLYTRWREGEAKHSGVLEDYAYFALALLTMGKREQAELYMRMLLERFFDYENGGFYLYASDAEQLFIRPKETYDNAIPSGNSVALLVLSMLAKDTQDEKLLGAYTKQLEFMKDQAQEYPMGHAFALYVMLGHANA